MPLCDPPLEYTFFEGHRQSITAIAKLAPNAKIGEGLSVHYSGGSSLSKDVAKWLEKNGVKTK